jgi:hypothetical protein
LCGEVVEKLDARLAVPPALIGLGVTLSDPATAAEAGLAKGPATMAATTPRVARSESERRSTAAI